MVTQPTTYTIPSDGVYRTPGGGKPVQWYAGTVISYAKALEYGLVQPLPTLPSTESQLIGALEAPLANLTFNADGSITDTGSIPTTTTFNADGTITTLYGAPTNRTVVTSFNADGSITEAAS